MTKFTVNATFDITCPWCYIGHTRLHRAIASHQARAEDKDDTFKINLIPFYLKPQQPSPLPTPLFPISTQSRRKLREETYGPVYAQQVVRNIQAAAEMDGLNLVFDGQTGATRNGHRLVWRAGKVLGDEAAEHVLDCLFRAYHERGVDITELNVLTDIGIESGVGSEEDVQRFLLSSEDGDQVDGLAERSRATLQGGVPSFDVCAEDCGRSEHLSGAVSTDAWGKLFSKLKLQSSS